MEITVATVIFFGILIKDNRRFRSESGFISCLMIIMPFSVEVGWGVDTWLATQSNPPFG